MQSNAAWTFKYQLQRSAHVSTRYADLLLRFRALVVRYGGSFIFVITVVLHTLE